MSKKFEGVLDQLGLTEMREPEQMSFDAYTEIKKIEKQIKLLKDWIKYYGTKDARETYGDMSDSIKKNKNAIKALEKAIDSLYDHDDALGL